MVLQQLRSYESRGFKVECLISIGLRLLTRWCLPVFIEGWKDDIDNLSCLHLSPSTQATAAFAAAASTATTTTTTTTDDDDDDHEDHDEDEDDDDDDDHDDDDDDDDDDSDEWWVTNAIFLSSRVVSTFHQY